MAYLDNIGSAEGGKSNNWQHTTDYTEKDIKFDFSFLNHPFKHFAKIYAVICW